MDPSISKCIFRDSFDKITVPTVLHTFFSGTDSKYVGKMFRKLNNNNNNNNNNNKGKCEPYEVTLYNDIEDFNMDAYPKLFDPFNSFSYEPFINRDSIVLSDIDAVFNFTNQVQGYIIKQNTLDYSFATMDDGPGGFTEYLLYRRPNAYGYGITPSSLHSLPFSKRIDSSRFNTYPGEGILKDEYKGFIKFVKGVEPVGMDVVVGNSNSTTILSPLNYMVQLIVGLQTIKIGGTFVCRIPDLNTNLIKDLLYITSQCFEKITLFKPLSTPLNNTYFIVGENLNVNNIQWVSYLENSYRKMVRTPNACYRLVEDSKEFDKWFREYNNLMLLYKKFLINTGNQGVTTLFDTYKFKGIWNLQ